MNSVSVIRRVVVWLVVVSFGIAAVGGIAVLLGAELGETAGRVLSTTALVGVFSIAVLCCAALLGRSLRVVGLVGVAVSLVTLVLTLVLVWNSSGDLPDAFFRWLGTGISATAALALGSLLLLLADRRQAVVRAGLWITLGLFAIVLALVVYLIWMSPFDSEPYARVLGILGILAALGAVVVPVLSLLLRDAGGAATPEGVTPAGAAELSSAVRERLRAEAAARGVDVDALVTRLLDEAPPA